MRRDQTNDEEALALLAEVHQGLSGLGASGDAARVVSVDVGDRAQDDPIDARVEHLCLDLFGYLVGPAEQHSLFEVVGDHVVGGILVDQRQHQHAGFQRRGVAVDLLAP